MAISFFLRRSRPAGKRCSSRARRLSCRSSPRQNGGHVNFWEAPCCSSASESAAPSRTRSRTASNSGRNRGDAARSASRSSAFRIGRPALISVLNCWLKIRKSESLSVRFPRWPPSAPAAPPEAALNRRIARARPASGGPRALTARLRPGNRRAPTGLPPCIRIQPYCKSLPQAAPSAETGWEGVAVILTRHSQSILTRVTCWFSAPV